MREAVGDAETGVVSGRLVALTAIGAARADTRAMAASVTRFMMGSLGRGPGLVGPERSRPWAAPSREAGEAAVRRRTWARPWAPHGPINPRVAPSPGWERGRGEGTPVQDRARRLRLSSPGLTRPSRSERHSPPHRDHRDKPGDDKRERPALSGTGAPSPCPSPTRERGGA